MSCGDGPWERAVRKGLWRAAGMGCGNGLWGAAGAAATPAAFNLGLYRLRGSYPPPAAAKTIHYRRDEGAAGGPFQTVATMVLQAGHSLAPRRWCCSDSRFWALNQESLHAGGRFQAKTCSDSKIHPIKSRITAAFGLIPRKTL